MGGNVKRIIFVMMAMLIFIPHTAAYAAKVEGLYPKLMVEDYIIEDSGLAPGEEATITVVIRNTNSIRSARNIRLSIEDNADEILPVKTASAICPYIGTENAYEWQVSIRAAQTAKDAPHILTVKMEYEDRRGNILSAQDTVIVDVVQPVRMEYTEPGLPPRVTQGDAFSFSMTLMNMGKSDIYNALLTFDINGISNGGSVLVGTLLPGEAKEGKANFRVSKEIIGEAEGRIMISYEDSRGKLYETIIPVSTVIEEKIVEIYSGEEEITENDFPWKTLAAGFGALAFVLLCLTVIFASKEKRLRKEYEQKL
jgi:hypothetical protein